MGNYASCCFPNGTPTSTRLLDSNNGSLSNLKLPMTAAEIMLEHPGNVVCPVDHLRSSYKSSRSRIQAMRADDEVLAGKLYLLVPLSRVNCKVSEVEMGLIESACEKKMLIMKKRGRVCSVSASSCRLEKDDDDDEGGDVLGLGRRRKSSCRQWVPDLEPISELPC